MSLIKISVIVPVYNVSRYLAKCLDSILSQTLKELEIILINDASPDAQDEIICQEYVKKDNRVVYIRTEVNYGVGYSRNYGLKIAKGSFISFIDSDDYLIDKQAYEMCYRKLIEGNYDFVSFGLVGVDQNYQIIKDIWFYDQIYNYVENRSYNSSHGFLNYMTTYSHEGNFLSFHSVDKIYKKDFLLTNYIEFSLDLKIGEDRLFCMAVYLNARKIYTFHANYYAYLQNIDSVTKQINRATIDTYLAMAIAEHSFLVTNDMWDSMQESYITISLPTTLRNISNKIESFTSTKIDENKLMGYFRDRLKDSPLFDIFFISPVFASRIFKPDPDFTDKQMLQYLFKSIFKKIVNIRYIKDKLLGLKSKIVGKVCYRLIKMYGKVHNLSNKNIWLISERDDEAKDNGYAFFKYLREHQPNINAYYLMKEDFKNQDYLKVLKLGNVVDITSFKAMAYYYYSKYCFSSHTELYNSIAWQYAYCHHNNPLNILMSQIRKNKKYIFLQHGITKDYLPKAYLETIAKHNYFVCGANEEYKFLKQLFSDSNYSACKLIYSGFARFDYLEDLSSSKKQILLMPTWRIELVFGSLSNKDSFLTSNYYYAYQNLINNPDLIKLLEESSYQLIFFPHYEINSRYLDTFSSTSKNIIIASCNKYDVSTLIKDSKLMITDYSSVFWDFGYMEKPIIYYQFDKDFFRATQYKEAYFIYDRDGFGPVIEREDAVVKEIERYFTNNFIVENEYIAKLKQHFTYGDKNNCQRIFEAITESSKKD